MAEKLYIRHRYSKGMFVKKQVYDEVILSSDHHSSLHFKSGDVVKDWYNAMQAVSRLIFEDDELIYDDSVTDFLKQSLIYDCLYLHEDSRFGFTFLGSESPFMFIVPVKEMINDFGETIFNNKAWYQLKIETYKNLVK